MYIHTETQIYEYLYINGNLPDIVTGCCILRSGRIYNMYKITHKYTVKTSCNNPSTLHCSRQILVTYHGQDVL